MTVQPQEPAPYHGRMSSPYPDPPQLPAAEFALLSSRVEEIRALAAEHGITELRFASPGRLVGHVASDGDPFAVIDFELATRDLLGAEVRLYSDAVLSKPNVSPDLVAAEAL